MVVFDIALLSFKGSTPGAYGLKASNAALSIATSLGTSPRFGLNPDKVFAAKMV
jgi:hypothetical protein